MRSVFSVLSVLFVIGVGCSVEPPPASPTQPDEVVTQGLGHACPTICGVGTQCQMRDGTCREACNPCLCQAAGGTVVPSCGAATSTPSESSAAPTPAPAEDDSFGVICGTAVCGKGTFCCNASCSVCAPNGGGCTQQVCERQD